VSTTVTSCSFLAPQSDTAIPSADNAANPSTDFFTLLLALFPAQGVQSQGDSVSLNTLELANTPSSGLESIFSPEPFGESDREEDAASGNTVAPEQTLLLSVFAPLLWRGPLSGAETPVTMRAVSQQQPGPVAVEPSELNVGTSGVSNVNAEKIGIGQPFLAPLTQETLSVDSKNSPPAVTPDTSGPEANDGRPLFPQSVDGALNAKTVKRGDLNPSEEQLPDEMPFPNIDPSREGKRGDGASLLSQAPNTDPAENPQAKDFSLPLATRTPEKPLSQEASQEIVPSGRARNAVPQPEADFVKRGVEKHGSPIQNEQVFAELSSLGKTREATSQKFQTLTHAEAITANMPGNMPTTAAPRPENAARAGNIESWREVVNQVSAGILTSVEQNSREARLQLAPPELGKLDIQLVVEGEQIRAHIVAESADVGALIQTHLPELKQALQSHRLDLDTVRVDVQTSSGGADMSSRNPGHETRSYRQRGNHTPMSTTELDTEAVQPMPRREQRGRVNVWV